LRVIHHDGVEITLKVKEMDSAIDGDNQSKSLKTLRLGETNLSKRGAVIKTGTSRDANWALV
jgi:hypothetical protein